MSSNTTAGNTPFYTAKPSGGWKRYLVKVGDKIDENKPLLTMNDKLLVSLGGILTLSGKPKSCKTFLTSAIAGAFFTGEYLNIVSTNDDEEAVLLLCDTEQGRARTQQVLKRIQRICGLSDEELDERVPTISIREISPNERMRALFDAISDIKPKLVIIDGVRDLLKDFNNINESVDVVNQIMKAATDNGCAIVVVIHLNKGDDNIRGHLGSELCNKSETVARLKLESNGAVTVEPLHCRDIEFDEFAFRISDNGLPVLCATIPKESKDEKHLRELKELFNLILDSTKTMSKKELISAIVEVAGVSDKTADRRIKDAVKEQIIKLLPNNSYTLI